MRKNSGEYRKWRSICCTILLIGSSLLCGCTSQPDDQGQTKLTETTNTAEVSGATQGSRADKTEPSTGESDDPSLLIFRQTMVETPQLFAAAFFGYVPQDADPFAHMQEAAPSYARICRSIWQSIRITS